MNTLKNKYILVSISTLLLSIILIVGNTFIFKPKNSKPYTNFLNDINHNKVSTIYYTNSPELKIKLKDGHIYTTDNPRNLDFKENMLKQKITVLEQGYVSPFEVIPYVLLISSSICCVIFLIKFSRIKSRGINSVDGLDVGVVNDTGFNFENVAGNEEAKESVKDIVDFLKNPEKYSQYGAKMPRGIILHGSPGTGKTLLAKAVAGEASVPFYAMSGSDFIQIYVGVGASRIRQLFRKAKAHGKAVIFIDEIDAIGKKRSTSGASGSDERDQTLNALLTEMSGFKENDGIIVMAATNRLDILDDALLRPGRFDRHVEITLPDVEAREKILNLHLKNKPFKNIDILDLAKKTSMFSGAKLEHLINEAAILACKEGTGFIEKQHLDKSFSIVIAGYEKQNRGYIKNIDKKITAYHEAGHALISAIMLPQEKLSKVTIIPTTNGTGGYTLSIPEDALYQNKDYLLKRIMVLLGGRAAEEIIFGDEKITTGAYSDLKHSTNLVKNMITSYGMGNSLGLLTIDEIGDLSTSSKDLIVEECKTLIDDLYNKTKETLLNSKETLETLTASLLEKESLDYEDLKPILSLK